MKVRRDPLTNDRPHPGRAQSIERIARELRARGVERHESKKSQQKQQHPQGDGACLLPRRVADGSLYNQTETIREQKREPEGESGMQIQPQEKQRWYPKQEPRPIVFITTFEQK